MRGMTRAADSPRPYTLRQRLQMRFINFYPPFFGAGIRVVSVSPDWRTIKVQLALSRSFRWT